MTDVALTIEGGATFLTVYGAVALAVLAVTFGIMLWATYNEWKDGTLW